MIPLTIEEINNRKPNGSRLTAVSFSASIRQHNGQSVRMIECICACGNKKVVRQISFLSSTKSCGCLLREKCPYLFFKEKSIYPIQLRTVYFAMIARCYKNTSSGYIFYGAMGVVVCEEWLLDKVSFLDWALKNGWQKGLQLDKDILYCKKHGGQTGRIYSPEYCCFVTRKVNGRNTRATKKYLFKGENITIPEISEITGVNRNIIRQRIVRDGMSMEDAVIPTDKSIWKKAIKYINGIQFPEMETEEYQHKIRNIKETIALINAL